jgi:hypothetical protein
VRRLFGLPKEKQTPGSRKLYNEEPHDFVLCTKYYYGNKLRRMKCAEHVARMGEMRNTYKIFVGKLERRSLGRPSLRWHVIMYLIEIVREVVVGLIQDFVNMMMNFRVP